MKRDGNLKNIKTHIFLNFFFIIFFSLLLQSISLCQVFGFGNCFLFIFFPITYKTHGTKKPTQISVPRE